MDRPIFYAGDEVFLSEQGTETKGRVSLVSGSQLVVQTEDGRRFRRGINLVRHARPFAAKRKPLPAFTVNERFSHLSQAIEMVAQRISPSLIVVGPGGLGKTYEVKRTLKALGMIQNTDYFHVKGYSSARGLYETLHANNGRLTVFDDCDSALTDPVAKQLLKGALDSYDQRTISWLSASTKADSKIPPQFDFDGHVIFISNRSIDEIDDPICGRSFVIDLHMTEVEILNRMETLLPHIEIKASSEQRRMAMDFIKEWAPSIKQLNLRTLIHVLRIIKAHPNNWQRLAIFTVSQG